jgi:hypothetical protein
MSKYLDHIGKNLPKYAKKNEDEFGFLDALSEGISNQKKLITGFWGKKGVAGGLKSFAEEVGDYKEVRDTISNRPLVLRKAAKKIRGVRFDQSMEKKISNYKNSGWSNILSQTPTSPAEANAIVAGMFYIAGNIYQKNDLLKTGDTFLNRSENASSTKDVTASLKILDEGVSKLKKQSSELGIMTPWYNFPKKITNAFSKSNPESALNIVFNIAEQMHSKEEIDFAEAMRAERMEDRSPLMEAIVLPFGIVIGGIVLYFTAPIWIPAAKTAVTSGAKLATKGAKGAGKLLTTGTKKATGLAKSAAKSTSNFAKNSAKEIIEDSIKLAKQAAENIDTTKFQKAAENIMKNMGNAGVQPNSQLMAQNQKLKRMLSQKSSSQQEDNAKKQEMKKMISQVVSQMKDAA